MLRRPLVSSHSQSRRLAPLLHVRGPTHGVLDDVGDLRWLKEQWIEASGVETPTVLAVNLEGRFPTSAALVELVLPLAKAVSAGSYGQLALTFCTPDEATKVILRALAEANETPFFIANSIDEVRDAEAVGPLTATDLETLEILRGLGGRTTVSIFATEASLEPSAAHNRLVGVRDKGLVQWQDRSRREGKLYLDPRQAVPSEDPADPSAADFEIPEPIRSDIRALAEMQGRDPNALYAEAMGEFLARHREHLEGEHERLRDAIAADDVEALKTSARLYAKKQALARRRRKAG
jgi:hypothetical protein